jgi:hypothetical protein
MYMKWAIGAAALAGVALAESNSKYFSPAKIRPIPGKCRFDGVN